MIKPEELRPGNLVQTSAGIYRDDRPNIAVDVYEFITLTPDLIDYIKNPPSENPTRYHGIHLNKQMAGFLGFAEDNGVWTRDSVTLQYTYPLFYNTDGEAIRNVHDLQNLYFKVEGEELDMSGIPKRVHTEYDSRH